MTVTPANQVVTGSPAFVGDDMSVMQLLPDTSLGFGLPFRSPRWRSARRPHRRPSDDRLACILSPLWEHTPSYGPLRVLRASKHHRRARADRGRVCNRDDRRLGIAR